jgi:hypothetical protein
MAMELDQIVPFGRTGKEYERMFNLTAQDLQQRILGCGAVKSGWETGAHRLEAFQLSTVDPALPRS